jgi:hypothetical protein
LERPIQCPSPIGSIDEEHWSDALLTQTGTGSAAE